MRIAAVFRVHQTMIACRRMGLKVIGKVYRDIKPFILEM
jgi:hypothetical protein